MAFKGKVAVIFGGASGMGRIAAHRLADAGADVAVCDISEAGLAATAKGRARIRSYVCDVSELAQVEKTVRAIEMDLGPIDRVTHTAAIMPTGPALEDEPRRVARVMRINYEGTVNVVLTTLPKMIARKQGDLIVFGSVAGEVPSPLMSAYNASKAAINNYMETVIYENRGSGVRIHLACPPMVDTPLVHDQLHGPNAHLFEKAYKQKVVARPDAIVDAIERALEQGTPISYPHVLAKSLSAARRISRRLVWELILRS